MSVWSCEPTWHMQDSHGQILALGHAQGHVGHLYQQQIRHILCSDSEAGSYLRLIDVCITQLSTYRSSRSATSVWSCAPTTPRHSGDTVPCTHDVFVKIRAYTPIQFKMMGDRSGFTKVKVSPESRTGAPLSPLPRREGPSRDIPGFIFGETGSFLEPFCGHLSPKVDQN